MNEEALTALAKEELIGSGPVVGLCRQLQRAVLALKAERDALRDLNMKDCKLIDQLTAERDGNKCQIGALKQLLSEARAERDALRITNAMLKASVNESQRAYVSCEAERDALKAQVKAVLRDDVKIADENYALKEEVGAARQAVRFLASRLVTSAKECEALKAQFEKAHCSPDCAFCLAASADEVEP